MKKFFRILSVICLIGWMGLIFYFSHQTAEKSSAISGSLISFLAQRFYPGFNLLSLLERQELIASLQSVVRSVAHYCIFGGLGFFAYLTFVSYTSLKYKVRIFWMLETGLLYAIIDEFHQSFVDGRSMQIVDILVDFGGVATAVLVCGLFVFIVKPLQEKVKYKEKTVLEMLDISETEERDYLAEYLLQLEQGNQIKEPVILKEDLTNIIENETENEIEIDNEVQIDNEIEMEIETDNQIKMDDEIETEIKSEIKNKPEKEESLLSEEFEYASAIIGKTVVEATKVCNELSLKDDEDKVELVNLVLGRTEILKAETLKILSSELDFEQKKDLMKNEQSAAFDYFDSIKAQIG